MWVVGWVLMGLGESLLMDYVVVMMVFRCLVRWVGLPVVVAWILGVVEVAVGVV